MSNNIKTVSFPDLRQNFSEVETTSTFMENIDEDDYLTSSTEAELADDINMSRDVSKRYEDSDSDTEEESDYEIDEWGTKLESESVKLAREKENKETALHDLEAKYNKEMTDAEIKDLMNKNYAYPDPSDPHLQYDLYPKTEFHSHKIHARPNINDYNDIKE